MVAISRRKLLAVGAAAITVGPGQRVSTAPAGGWPGGRGTTFDGNPFALGVTSGDPDEHSAVLWTRLTQADGGVLGGPDLPLRWEIADDASFDRVVSSGETIAYAVDGHSVHLVVELAGPAYFRFLAGAWASPVGRVAPTPADRTTAGPLRIAAASCQHFETGFFAAHRDIAEWQPDLVVFLGDFIYEYAANEVGGNVVRSHVGEEVMAIDDYRTRYAQYLADPDLRAARAACPWLVIWDDHEVENNYAASWPENAADAGGFPARRRVAYQAWWEHMPLRIARPAAGEVTIYRTVRWGDLADLILLDGRQYRSDQACGDVTLDVDPPCPEALDGSRTMLGAEQEQWLVDELAASSSTWAVLGQQTVVTDVRLPNGAILNYDQWDGYAPARGRLLLAAAQAERVIVLTGDIHLAATGLLGGVGVEFVTTSISSFALIPAELEGMVRSFADVVDVELAHRGYTRHVVTRDSWTAEFRVVEDVSRADSAVSTWKSFTVDAAAPGTVRPS